MSIVPPGNNYRGNPRGTNSDEEARRAQAELMWDDRINGLTNKQIAEKYGLGERTVTYRFKEFPREGFDRSVRTQRSGNGAQDLELMAETAKMWEEKHAEHLTNKQLAERYGLHVNTVQKRLASFFPEKATVTLEKQRIRESDKLDMLEEVALELMNTEHLVVDRGAVVLDPRTKKPMIDSEPKFKAIKTVLDIMARRAKMFGIDAPVKAEVTHNAGVEIQVTELQDLVDEAKKKQYDREQEVRKALGFGPEIQDAEVVEDDAEQAGNQAGDGPEDAGDAQG